MGEIGNLETKKKTNTSFLKWKSLKLPLLNSTHMLGPNPVLATYWSSKGFTLIAGHQLIGELTISKKAQLSPIAHFGHCNQMIWMGLFSCQKTCF